TAALARFPRWAARCRATTRRRTPHGRPRARASWSRSDDGQAEAEQGPRGRRRPPQSRGGPPEPRAEGLAQLRRRRLRRSAFGNVGSKARRRIREEQQEVASPPHRKGPPWAPPPKLTPSISPRPPRAPARPPRQPPPRAPRAPRPEPPHPAAPRPHPRAPDAAPAEGRSHHPRGQQ